jgi:hypothetical protein
MKLKKKEDQSVDTSFLLRMGNKIPMEGVTETKTGAEMERRTIQRLPHPGIHTIINHQQQYELTSTPRAHVSSCICSRGWPVQPLLGGEALGFVKIICPSTGECRGQEAGVGRLGRGMV